MQKVYKKAIIRNQISRVDNLDRKSILKISKLIQAGTIPVSLT